MGKDGGTRVARTGRSRWIAATFTRIAIYRSLTFDVANNSFCALTTARRSLAAITGVSQQTQ